MAALFPNASNFNVENLTQINQANSQSPDDAALDKLHAHISGVAMHTSSARVDAPKCHEDTREAVQQDVLSWTEACGREPTGEEMDSIEVSSQPESSSHSPGGERGSAGPKAGDEILWLTGPAGTGKTAIMGTVSDRLEEEGQLAATFYFSESRGAAGTTSKERFVTTLAYQMVVHPGLNDRLAPPMMAAIRKNPAIFQMSLGKQLEVLILAPLRALQNATGPTLPFPTSIIVDGVDECGESSDRRTREKDQLEVLAILLQAMKDPAFPFRIIVASRPETWIRRYLTEKAIGHVHEIFLDEKYSPDDDIQLYLESKFGKIARESGINPLTWPTEDAIAKLVENASGQFIYAATVVRWVETPGAYPQAQLDAVLNLKIPRGAESHPLAMLDALYTSILKSTPNPETSVLWVKAIHYMQEVADDPPPSAWTVDRLFESHEGQAQSILGGLPSLVYKVVGEDTDLRLWERKNGRSVPRDLSGPECNASYAFYHKSFLDYLDDDSRCGVEFPNLDKEAAEAWLTGRISQTLKAHGTEVPVAQPLLPIFQRCLLEVMVDLAASDPPHLVRLDANALGGCTPNMWLTVLEVSPDLGWDRPNVLRALYILVHSNCHQGRPCNRGCKRWRGAISKLPSEQWRNPEHRIRWTREDLRLDRFCIKRLPVETITKIVFSDARGGES